MKFSILLPNHNGEKYIEGAIKSIISQAYDDYEVIVVDGKSTDASHSILEKICRNNSKINWIKYKDNGISDALNCALQYATGEVIGYLGCDDYYNNNVFQAVSNHIKTLDKFSWIYGNSYNVYEEKKSRIIPRFLGKKALYFGNFVGLQNVFFNKDVLAEYKFDINNKYSMDYELWFRLIENNYFPIYIDITISYNIQHNNISCSNMQGDEAYNVALDHARKPFERILVYSVKYPRLKAMLQWIMSHAGVNNKHNRCINKFA